tara:strand:+ start:11526 stop:12185 length:660 start_codon:yes stop_codon:yes gene_type:complete
MNINNDNMRKPKDNINYIDRNIYARYLIDRRKSERVFKEQTITLNKYINNRVNNTKEIDEIDKIDEIDEINENILSYDNTRKPKDNINYIDRNIYARYLIDRRKSERVFKEQKITLNKYINNRVNNKKEIDEIDEIDENILSYDNCEIKIKKIIIDNTIYIDVKNVKNIKIITVNNDIKIELDKYKNKKIINDVEILSKNIKELDTLLNLFDIFLTLLK